MKLIFLLLMSSFAFAQDLKVGVMQRGALNAITDVAGVQVGHETLIKGNSIRTGITAILPHKGNVFQEKVPAAVYVGNGFGKLTGISQIQELGTLETPILLTNTLSVSAALEALVTYTLERNKDVRSVNGVVGETNDGYLNDIRARVVSPAHALNAIRNAKSGKVKEGNVGAGTGTVCFGFKGGIGTSSRVLPASLGAYTVGVLVQTNFGGVLSIAGVPVGEELGKYSFREELNDGSCMIVLATDAPLDASALERLAKRAFMGLARTGGIASNGSGDYVLAFSSATQNRVSYAPNSRVVPKEYLHTDAMTPLFMAAIEATEEAIYRSLFMAETMEGRDGHRVEALPKKQVEKIFKKYGRNF